jgi:hypothetical protein
MPNYPGLPKHCTPEAILYKQLCHINVPEGPKLDTYVSDTGERVVARQLTADSVTIISVWCHAEIVAEHDALDYDMTFQALTVPTNNGPMRATQGDYIVRRADGSFEVVKAYKFRSNFREV